MRGLFILMTFVAGLGGSRSSADELRELADQFRGALKCYVADDFTKDCGRLFNETRQPERIARFVELLSEDQARDREFVEPLVWASKQAATWGASQPRMATLGDRARTLLVRHHINEKSIGLALSGMLFLQAGSRPAEALLREALAKNSHREVQGRACYWLAMYLKFQAECIPTLSDSQDASNLCKSFETMWGKEAVERLKAKDPSKLFAEAQGLFARAVEQYGDVKAFGLEAEDQLLGDVAGRNLHEVRDLVPGREVPDIVGEDADGKTFRLSEFLGNVVLLTFSGDWCAPCRAMYPQERELIQRNKGKPFVILSVNTDADRETLKNSIREGTIMWRCWWDRPGRRICKEWNVTSFPTIYLIDRAGVIRYKNLRGKALDEAVNSLLLEAARR